MDPAHYIECYQSYSYSVFLIDLVLPGKLNEIIDLQRYPLKH